MCFSHAQHCSPRVKGEMEERWSDVVKWYGEVIWRSAMPSTHMQIPGPVRKTRTTSQIPYQYCNRPTRLPLNIKYPQLLSMHLNGADEFSRKQRAAFWPWTIACEHLPVLLPSGCQSTELLNTCECLAVPGTLNMHHKNSILWAMFEVWIPTANLHHPSALHGVFYPKPIWQPTAFPSKLGPSAILHMTKLAT